MHADSSWDFLRHERGFGCPAANPQGSGVRSARLAQAGTRVAQLSATFGMTEATIYNWTSSSGAKELADGLLHASSVRHRFTMQSSSAALLLFVQSSSPCAVWRVSVLRKHSLWRGKLGRCVG